MKLSMLVLTALIASSCSHKTIYEKCTEDWTRYGSMDACMATKPREMTVGQAVGGIFKSAGDGLTHANQNQVHCTTTGQTIGGQYYGNTNCR